MRKRLKLITIILLVCCVFLSAVIPVCAKPSDLIYDILSRNSHETGITHPLLLKALHKNQPVRIIKDKQGLKEIKDKLPDTNNKLISGDKPILGLDISKWNGDIDWDAVKQANIEFVIIRAGYSTYYTDPYFKQNIEAAIDHNILVGVYWFSYAHSYQGAKLEAEKCYEVIKPYKEHIALPVFWDFEYDSVNTARRKGYHISKTLASGMADTFCTTIKNKGLRAGIYTNIDYTQRYFSKEVLSKYHTWIAQWTSSCTYREEYIIWQCSEDFNIKGKKFDLNYLYPSKFKKDIDRLSNLPRKEMTVVATAYSGDSSTSLMTKPHWGVIAVDPSVIPYGSIVYIPYFDEYFVAEDCGGAIIGNRIDIFMNKESQCVKWGKRKIKIEIVR